MEISIRSKNVEVSEYVKEYVEKKLFSVTRFIPHMVEKEEEDREKIGEKADRIIMEVELEQVAGAEYRTEVHLKLPRKTIRAEGSAETLRESIDKTRESLEKAVRRYKEKVQDLSKKGGKEAKEKRNK